MELHLNPDLNPKALADAYKTNKRGQVLDILPKDQAEAVYQCLSAETPWWFQYYGPGGERVKIPPEKFNAMPQEEKAAAFNHILSTAATQFQYMYYFFPIMQSIERGENPGFLLHRVNAFLNSEPVLDLVREITGIQEVVRADSMATKFIGNCFLHSHLDQREGGNRRVAYVLNMTRKWDPNWGGYLQFYNDDYNIEQSFMPRFNTLNLFTVPQGHSVATVPPFCPGERLSVVGWFRDNTGPDND